jgi:UDP-2-acetamido-3-amino-2,3-dideoxy-glucuronate N-acetyltransferase
MPADLDRGTLSDGVVVGKRVVIEFGARLVAPRLLFNCPDTDLVVRDDAVIGAGALVAGASVIGPGARVAPGAVVTQDVPAHAIVAGNPARVVGYSAPAGSSRIGALPVQVSAPTEPGSVELIGGAMLYRFPEVVDLRGHLTFGEVGGSLPFEVKRFFCVYGVPSAEIRGEHAHRTLHELLICVSGSLRVSLTDGRKRSEVVLDSPTVGLHLPPFIWSTQFQQGPSTVLLVLCSEPYDQASYIRDYDGYLALVS